jgi:hypothetical protein
MRRRAGAVGDLDVVDAVDERPGVRGLARYELAAVITVPR